MVNAGALLKFFDKKYPLRMAEEWDNVGLLLGSPHQEVRRVLLCLDVTNKVAQEAIGKKVDLIVAHHPLIFKGFKKIVDSDPKQKVAMELIKNNISVICLHTNLDRAKLGLNQALAEKIGLKHCQNVNENYFDKIVKLVVFVPKTHSSVVRDAILNSGAGFIGNYSHCSFSCSGQGTFLPLKGTSPFLGQPDQLEIVEEERIETVVQEADLNKVIAEMRKVHPYEEIAMDILPVNSSIGYSYAKVGELERELSLEEFAAHLKNCLQINSIRMVGVSDKIKRVVVFSGSFDGNFEVIRRSGADVLVTGDLKYHTAVDALEEGLMIADCGHFGTEFLVTEALETVLKENFPDLEMIQTKAQEDPFRVF